VDIGSCNKEFHDSRRNNKGANALSIVTDALEAGDVNNRVALRLFVGVDVDGIFLTQS